MSNGGIVMEIIVGIVGVVVLGVLGLIAKGYVKAPPDVAYIVSGLRKEPKIVVGKATFVLPFFERIDRLVLRLMQVDIKTASAVPTKEYINIFVDGVANIKIKSDEMGIKKAAEAFLGRSQGEIASIAQQVIEGNLREIVGQLELKELIQNRDKFAVKVQESVAEDMGKMGLEVVNLTIQNFTDKTGTIENLGIDNVVKISQNAAIARAEAEKNIKVAQADAEKESNRARAEAETEIALQNKDLAIKKAEFKKEEARLLPPELNYEAIAGLRLEARQKLMEIRPMSIGQASRISGVSPADIAVLLIYLEQRKGE